MGRPDRAKVLASAFIGIGLFSAGILTGTYLTPREAQVEEILGEDPPIYGIVLTYSPDPPLAGQVIRFTIRAFDGNDSAVSGAIVMVAMEAGERPMSSMEMVGGMVRIKEREPSVYEFGFRFNQTGPYTVHVHVIRPGGHISEMMRNHADFGPLVVHQSPPRQASEHRGQRVYILPSGYDPRSGRGFSPSTVSLILGINSTVTWINNDISSHTVTAVDGSFTSPLLNPGRSWSYRFTAPGIYRYLSNPHPWMLGTVVVLPPPV